MGRVRVTTCNVANAPSIRALLEAHGIAATTSDGGPYASFNVDVWVDEADAEQAAALLAELRDAPADPEPDDDDEPDAFESVELRLQRKRAVGVSIILSCFITFGTGHFFARRWLRGLGCAALEIAGIRFAVHGMRVGLAMVLGAIALDAIGSALALRARFAPAQLPAARVRR